MSAIKWTNNVVINQALIFRHKLQCQLRALKDIDEQLKLKSNLHKITKK